MTPNDYRKTYSDKFKKFLETPEGQHFVATLNAMRPPYEFSQQNHLLIENRGAIRGYEVFMRNMLSLAIPYTVQQEVEPTYGIPNKISQNQ